MVYITQQPIKNYIHFSIITHLYAHILPLPQLYLAVPSHHILTYIHIYSETSLTNPTLNAWGFKIHLSWIGRLYYGVAHSILYNHGDHIILYLKN